MHPCALTMTPVMTTWALAIGRRHTRTGTDDVAELIGRLSAPLTLVAPDGVVTRRDPSWQRPPEHTDVDLVTATTTEAATLMAALWQIRELQKWWVGVGAGTPDPSDGPTSGPGACQDSARARARSALGQARAEGRVAVVWPCGAQSCARVRRAVQVLLDASSALTPRARAVAELYDRGMTTGQAAQTLGVSGPAVSQRLPRQHWEYLVDVRALAVDLAAEAARARVETSGQEGSGRAR